MFSFVRLVLTRATANLPVKARVGVISQVFFFADEKQANLVCLPYRLLWASPAQGIERSCQRFAHALRSESPNHP
jgi:hypothetical protein